MASHLVFSSVPKLQMNQSLFVNIRSCCYTYVTSLVSTSEKYPVWTGLTMMSSKFVDDWRKFAGEEMKRKKKV